MDVMDLFSEEITEWLDSSNDSTYDVHEGELDHVALHAHYSARVHEHSCSK